MSKEYLPAGYNRLYKFGQKAQKKLLTFRENHPRGYYSIPVDCEGFWLLGTTKGLYGDYICFDKMTFSVNNGGYAYAKADTEKGQQFLSMLDQMQEKMIELRQLQIDGKDWTTRDMF